MRLLSFIFLLLFLTGCYTYIQAPGAVGRVVDADTGKPVRDARITRPPLIPGQSVGGKELFVPFGGVPATTISSDKSGRFNLAPATHTQIRFMYLRNPKGAIYPSSFLISAEGYATNELHGIATSHTLWRVDLGKVLLKKP